MTPPDTAALFVLLARVSTILAVAWLLTRASWSGSASVRHAVWCGALAAVVLLPLTVRWLPTFSVPFPQAIAFSPSPPDPDPSTTPVDVSGYAGPAQLSGTSIDALSDPGGLPATEPPQHDVAWWQVLFAVWVVGTILRMAWLLVLHARTRLLTSRARPSSSFDALVTVLSSRLGLHRRIRVLTGDDVRMPLTWGIHHPVILLPREALLWTEERLGIVLLHELSHIRRRDYLTALLAEVACAIYWPSPLVWVARRRVRMEQEQACDDRVLSMGVPAVAYADHLLAIARMFYGDRWSPGVAVAMARQIGLKHRVVAILDDRTDRRPLRSLRGVLVAMCAVALFLPVSTLRSADRTLRPELAGSAPVPDAPAADVETPSAVTAPAYLWLEAEDGAPARTTFAQGGLAASQAAFLVLKPSSPGAEALRIDLEVATRGDYFLWTRIDAVASAEYSGVRVWTDGDLADWEGTAIATITDDDTDVEWAWVRVVANGIGEGFASPSGLPLESGRHSLRIATLDGSVRIDRILLTSDPHFTPVDKGARAPLRPIYTLLEAEEGVQTGRIRNRSDEHASGSRFVVFKEGRRASSDAEAEFTFEIVEGGRYLIWGRTYAEDEESNSFYVSLDGGANVTWDLPVRSSGRHGPQWAWDPVSRRTEGDRRIDPMAFDLRPGRHVLRLRTRESGAHLDALLITNDLGQRPDGIWPEALPERPLRLELPARVARLRGPIALQTAAGASEGVHLAVEKEGRARKPGPSGLATFEFEATEAGLYSFWARTVAPSSKQDSFWVRIDDGEWILWNGIPQSREWHWAMVRDTGAEGRLVQRHLEAGVHIVEIAGREGGVKIERLLVTNDPLLQPS